ncbi:hypothetical protein FRX31_009412 [Thalictrum thalictroides]|uniref:Uncharacterized protein n=1 Tax=Thalictrum thalictroides TaxID=46969 RepID=A0A7J6WWR7_THATH|nr:hypothetical protein FRX31_009412 [Thalictrum thalictroides]
MEGKTSLLKMLILMIITIRTQLNAVLQAQVILELVTIILFSKPLAEVVRTAPNFSADQTNQMLDTTLRVYNQSTTDAVYFVNSVVYVSGRVYTVCQYLPTVMRLLLFVTLYTN